MVFEIRLTKIEILNINNNPLKILEYNNIGLI